MTNNIDTSHGTYGSYILGFGLSVVLTLISYFMVTSGVFKPSITYVGITLLAIVQLLVQLVFFLHLDSEEGPRWNLISFIFTAMIVVILVGGSLWVMYHMNANMM